MSCVKFCTHDHSIFNWIDTGLHFLVYRYFDSFSCKNIFLKFVLLSFVHVQDRHCAPFPCTCLKIQNIFNKLVIIKAVYIIKNLPNSCLKSGLFWTGHSSSRINGDSDKNSKREQSRDRLDGHAKVKGHRCVENLVHLN